MAKIKNSQVKGALKSSNKPLEEYTGEIQELSEKPVNMADLLNQIDLKKTSNVFQQTKDKKIKSRPTRTYSSSRSKSIDGALRDIIREEVRHVFDDFYNDLLKEISLMISREQVKSVKPMEPKTESLQPMVTANDKTKETNG